MSLFFEGKIHKKIFSEKPLADKDVFTADAPGSGVILMFSFTHSFTNIAPGSEIPGVPASEISEMI